MEEDLLANKRLVRLAMVGMVEGNGHPYSWSAILNGFDSEKMAKCPFPVIPAYLSKEPKETLGILEAQVTHIWTDNPADACRVAEATFIPCVVKRPEEVIGHVDAVIVPTDKGHEHVVRCQPFIEAGLPVFVDKPMVDNETDLKTFCKWVAEGSRIMSSSCMRYCKEYMPYQVSTRNLGRLRYVSITMSKSWERYGIHALEGVYPILGRGFLSARNTGTVDRNVVHFKHRSGADVVVVATDDMVGSFGVLTLCGTASYAQTAFSDISYAFKAQLASFIGYLREGIRPFPFTETIELMKMVIAGTRSREEGGREVMLAEISEG
jgi:hypothetical protein